jgi:hypothetical protein
MMKELLLWIVLAQCGPNGCPPSYPQIRYPTPIRSWLFGGYVQPRLPAPRQYDPRLFQDAVPYGPRVPQYAPPVQSPARYQFEVIIR